MRLDGSRVFSGRGPWWIIAGWSIVAVLVLATSPNLTRLAAEGQARMLANDAESRQAAALLDECWPDQAYASVAAITLHRAQGLRDEDRRFVRALAADFVGPGAPAEIHRVLGPDSRPEIADRLLSRDRSAQLLVVPLSSSFVAPRTHEIVGWLEGEVKRIGSPAGLEVRWTGDAVVGREYMKNVQTSLDRAAIATVALLLIVLLFVYRSVWLALVPLVTIGASLVIARGLLGWMMLLGWDLSPLVELFLIAVLFGTGTDFCLFLSWRYAERFNPENPLGALRSTLSRSAVPLMTSAGTIIVGLLLMGTTRFKLFSSTGPSVAIALVIALVATLSLTPALLLVLAQRRPTAFDGLVRASHASWWEAVGRMAMASPLRSWGLAVLAMIPLSVIGLRTHFIQDLLSELPDSSAAVRDFRLTTDKFDSGRLAPLTVMLESDVDLRSSQGLAMIDDVSRLLTHQRMLTEVRSATQPLGSPEPLERARLSSRLSEVDQGFVQIAAGARELQRGLLEGASKLRAALWLQRQTGLPIAGPPAPKSDTGLERAGGRGGSTPGLTAAQAMVDVAKSGGGVLSLPALSRAVGALRGEPRDARSAATQPSATGPESGSETMLRDLGRAIQGIGKIAAGAARAHREMDSIMKDPVGRRALDRLLINDETVRDHPDLRQSFDAYITPDGHHARIDLTQGSPVFSQPAMDQVLTLRRRLKDYLGEYEGVRVTARVAGANAESADIRTLTESDQRQSWIIVPIGVFLVLLIALRDPLACFNLVATMILTYAFALGATHLVFVSILGAEGLDWKTPYFLFVLLVAVGVDYNVFLMTRLKEESRKRGLREGVVRAISNTGGLISSAALITACSFASFLTSPLGSLRQLGFALAVGILVDAVLVRPVLVPCGHWLLRRSREALVPTIKIKRGTREYAVIPD